MGVGKAQIQATTHNGKSALCTIQVYAAPEWVQLNAESLELGAQQSFQLTAVFPPDSWSPVTYTSSDPAVAEVSADGRITGKSWGTAIITAQTSQPDVSAQVSVTVWDAPASIELPAQAELDVFETMALSPVIPEGSKTVFAYKSSKPAVATVSEDGTVTAVARGAATITVTAHNGVSAKLQLTVYDPWYPEAVELLNEPLYLEPGQSLQLETKLTPSTATAVLQWNSSYPATATVDDSGKVTALNSGYTVISAVADRNSDCCLSFLLVVQKDDKVLVLPKRTTNISGISANLNRIDAIRKTAIGEVDALQKSGAISSSDANKRRSMINNIFKDYSFPWMTPGYQEYWKAENSEGGVKDFKPGIVYYGMPYISGSYAGRRYNSTRALNEKRFVDSGNGYYMLNQDKLLSGMYVGNDCSALVNIAIWGTNSSHTGDRTGDIGIDPAYRTIASAKNMRPGDLLCWRNHHVVMFLYYVNPERTQIMIIENGGAEAGTNTVHCSLYDLSYYTSRGYKVRRLSSLK